MLSDYRVPDWLARFFHNLRIAGAFSYLKAGLKKDSLSFLTVKGLCHRDLANF